VASNEVFISYRREASWTLVEALYQRLTEAGIDAFYDIESLRAGQFELVILSQIRARPYFVLVLTPGTLERCAEPRDWLRREIEAAVDSDRVIVPVYTPTFELPSLEQLLPDGLGARIAGYNAVELPHKYFKFAVQQLTEEYLVPIELEAVSTPPEARPDVARIQQAAAEAPSVSAERLTAQEHFERATAKHLRGDLDEALADYTEAIRHDPTFATAFTNRGTVRFTQGDLAAARADYTEAIRADPTDPEPFYGRALARYTEGDADGAIADYDEAIRLAPSYAFAFGNRAIAREVKGDLDGALADYSEAIRLMTALGPSTGVDPNLALIFSRRGTIRAVKGDRDGSLADATEAIRLNPDATPPVYDRRARPQRH
jgi:tetratricopeptide (TPR) repeat protein